MEGWKKVERNNERKRRNHRLQGSELEKDKTITPPNTSPF